MLDKRNPYDLSHLSFSVGAIGALQTLSTIPVVAGDSMQLDLQGIFRLSPLRRNLTTDVTVDLFAFFVPHRHIYTNWEDFIKDGYDEAITLGTDSITSNLQCCGTTNLNGTTPRWAHRGYAQIWNRYFRDPTDDNEKSEDYLKDILETDDRRKYGEPCCYLPSIWNTNVKSELTSDDYTLASATDFDIRDLSLLKGRLKTEIMREQFSQRYADVIRTGWGTNVSTDADQRPTLIMRNTTQLSGYDVDTTDTAGVGTWAGKSVGVCDLRFPMRVFPEHGALWIMALLRFPTIHANEVHYLIKKSEPTYQQISGDPELVSRSAPIDITAGDVFFDSSDATSLGRMPYAQWYRQHPNYSHPEFANVNGFPFIQTDFTTRAGALYPGLAAYDGVFQSTQLKHWQSQVRVGLKSLRHVPDVMSSIFVGTGAT